MRNACASPSAGAVLRTRSYPSRFPVSQEQLKFGRSWAWEMIRTPSGAPASAR